MPDNIVSILMLGDIVGEPGLKALEDTLPALIKRFEADFVTANGENSSILGMTEQDARRIFAAGVDVITSGNHVWEKRAFWPFIDSEKRMLRPANYPSPAVGRGFVLVKKNNFSFLVINLQGREYMTPIDCPFRAFDRVIENYGSIDDELRGLSMARAETPVIIVDFHAESTKEKEALGFYVDGRASVFAGTHTHIQTADEKILPQGTAYISDLGMTGVLNGIIGMDKTICLERAKSQILYPLQSAEGAASIQGVCVQVILSAGSEYTPRAASIERFSAD
ncbi:MAG: YmdB family metallophosphoesterase [Spirochaetaceae bacterium]|jgi:metallophosphoesterase (TIGR00282 family)|nr:YmdB family metallophosphoesterase [Spirochaetaceae bacterium]